MYFLNNLRLCKITMFYMLTLILSQLYSILRLICSACPVCLVFQLQVLQSHLRILVMVSLVFSFQSVAITIFSWLIRASGGAVFFFYQVAQLRCYITLYLKIVLKTFYIFFLLRSHNFVNYSHTLLLSTLGICNKSATED